MPFISIAKAWNCSGGSQVKVGHEMTFESSIQTFAAFESMIFQELLELKKTAVEAFEAEDPPKSRADSGSTKGRADSAGST